MSEAVCSFGRAVAVSSIHTSTLPVDNSEMETQLRLLFRGPRMHSYVSSAGVLGLVQGWTVGAVHEVVSLKADSHN